MPLFFYRATKPPWHTLQHLSLSAMIQQLTMNYGSVWKSKYQMDTFIGANTKKSQLKGHQELHCSNTVLTYRLLAWPWRRPLTRNCRSKALGQVCYMWFHMVREKSQAETVTKKSALKEKLRGAQKAIWLSGGSTTSLTSSHGIASQTDTRTGPNTQPSRLQGDGAEATAPPYQYVMQKLQWGEQEGKSQYESISANVRDLSGLCSCLQRSWCETACYWEIYFKTYYILPFFFFF